MTDGDCSNSNKKIEYYCFTTLFLCGTIPIFKLTYNLSEALEGDMPMHKLRHIRHSRHEDI